MFDPEILRQQLISDLDHLHGLILRYAAGISQSSRSGDVLEGAVQVKLALMGVERAGAAEQQILPQPHQHHYPAFLGILRRSPRFSAFRPPH